jgi:phospholipid/cholesterol/gamma-HCH transport system substrate-binding protein
VEALPGVAGDLRPLVDDLGPALSQLRPTLASLNQVLAETPSLLDRVHGTVPPLTTALSSLMPVLEFLRPYTPEVASALVNGGSAVASYDANGHYIRVLGGGGSNTLHQDPAGSRSPFVHQNRKRPPGTLEEPPRNDAAGSPIE